MAGRVSHVAYTDDQGRDAGARRATPFYKDAMIHRLWKPWYVYRPSQIFRRLRAALAPPKPGLQDLPTSWGVTLQADPTMTVGHDLLVAGVYDLPLSEALARLIKPGDTVVDVGGNIGYTTTLCAVAAGPGGTVYSFEPHPELHPLIEWNVAAARRHHPIATTHVYQAALGATTGTAKLLVPPQFNQVNNGVSRITDTDEPGATVISVPMKTLDEVCGTATVSVVKIDVEGFELQVLEGGRRALESGRVRHVVFEDHTHRDSQVVRMLQGLGFHVFSLGYGMRGLVVAPVEAGSLAHGLEAPNFIATRDPDTVLGLGKTRGWLVLGTRLVRGLRPS